MLEANADNTHPNTILDVALSWHKHGYTPVPTRTNGEKRPSVDWKHYVDTPGTEEDLRRDFRGDTDGLGLVCGAGSGELEMLEVEGRAVHLVPDLAALMDENGFGEIWVRVNNGYVEASPSGGIHWHYRISDGAAKPNTKLASRLATSEEFTENISEKRKVLIETRGQGGFTVIAPSGGRTHPTGKSWVRLKGSPETVPFLTVAERDALYAIAGMLDQLPVIDEPKRPASTRSSTDGLRPGDDFNQRADWADILTGWECTAKFGDAGFGWTRPGKDRREGISATTGRNDGNNLYVFSTSTEFETQTPYSKFAAYTLLEHGGDYTAAAKSLGAQGYGEPAKVPDTAGPKSPFGAIPAPAKEAQPDKPPEDDLAGLRHIVLTSAAQIKPRPVFWLWKNRLALGTLGLLAGREGTGKSTLSYWITARLTKGELFGHYFGTPKAVLVCATEDSWEHTIVPRLMAADADLTKVFRVEVVNADDIHVGLSLPRDLLALERAAHQTGAALLLLDPLMSRLGDLDTHKDSEVRKALEPLVAIADRAHMSILGLMHHNKSGSSDPLQLIMASKAFTAVARSVHTVIPDPDDETDTRRFFGTPKNNLGRANLPTFSFTIAGHPIATDEGTAWTGKLEWGAELEGSIGEVMRSAAEDGEERGATSEAADWLSDYMTSKGGQVASADVKKAARAAGHAERTVKRAMTKLHLIVSFSGFPRASYWEIPAANVSPSGASRAGGPKELAPLAPLQPRGELSLSHLSLSEHESDPKSSVGPVGPAGPAFGDPTRGGPTASEPCYLCGKPPLAGRGVCQTCDEKSA